MAHLSGLLRWSPFKVDALGLLTLLGTREVDLGIGKLSNSWCTDYLPLFAGFVIATDAFREPMSGFAVHNITDGIYTDDVAGWFAKWLSCVEMNYSGTTIIVWTQSRHHPASTSNVKRWLSVMIGFTTFVGFLGLSILLRDWWAFANSVGLLLCVISRSNMIEANRQSLGLSAEDGLRRSPEVVKTFWTIPGGKSVSVFVPRGVLTEAILTTPRPRSRRLYAFYRVLAWAGFFVHVVSIGMAALPNQLLCVVVLTVSMVLLVKGAGSDESTVGSSLKIQRAGDRTSSMAAAFSRLKLDRHEEESMIAWRLMPHRRNRVWWQKYQDCVEREKEDRGAFSAWKNVATWKQYEQLLLTVAPEG